MNESSIRVTVAFGADVEKYWPFCEEYISKALAYGGGEMELSDVRERLGTGWMQLWMVHEDGKLQMCTTTEVIKFPRITALRMIHGSATKADAFLYAELYDYMNDWAKQQGIGRLEAVVRPGIARIGRAVGFTESHRVITREVH